MVRIAPINLYYNPKTLWFDAGDLDVRAGDGVIVSTAPSSAARPTTCSRPTRRRSRS